MYALLRFHSQSSTTSAAEAGPTVLRMSLSSSPSIRAISTVMSGMDTVSPPYSTIFTP